MEIGDNPAPRRGAESAVAESRRLMRQAFTATLASIDRASGAPFASLVTVAARPDGTPLMLLSTLARHTQNLAGDPRASLLFTPAALAAEPLTSARVTVMGEARRVEDDDAGRRFLARHPSATFYAGFADFGFFELTPARAHLVAGFGRIVDLAASELLIGTDKADSLMAAEAEIVSHMNSDHADVLELYATRLLGGSGVGWSMSGIDPEGLDLVRGADALRLVFPAPVRTSGEARKILISLAEKARGSNPD